VSHGRSRLPLSDGHRRPLWLAVSVAVFALGVGCLVLALARGGHGTKPPKGPAEAGKRVAREQVSGEVKPRRKPLIDANAAPPRWIRVPAIGVSAPVTPLGLNPDRSLQVPAEWGHTGWYKDGPEPGEQGPAVIAGHVDSKSGPAVFYRLGELHRGALISIRRADRSVVRFRVEGVERWPKDHFPTRRVYRPTKDAALRLITCGGSFNGATGHYLDNTIVYAARSPRSIR
jgi:sortase (surface protein transpeptidase)